MKQNEVAAWLSNPQDYEQGVRLFRRHVTHPKNPVAPALLKGPATRISRDMLRRELEAICGPQGLRPTRKTGVDPDTLPPSLRLLHERIKQAYRELNDLRGSLRAQLYTKAGAASRGYSAQRTYSQAARVMELDAFIRDAWAQLDYFQDHGTERDAEPNKVLYWLANQLPYANYVRKQRSQKNKTGNLSNPELFAYREKVLQEIAQYVKRNG